MDSFESDPVATFLGETLIDSGLYVRNSRLSDEVMLLQTNIDVVVDGFHTLTHCYMVGCLEHGD